MIQDFFDIIFQCVATVNSSAFFGVLLIALTLGALCWVACSYYTKLWHKRFHVRLQHHLLCCFAAVLTVVFTIVFHAVGNLEFIVNEMIKEWREELVENNAWGRETYAKAYDAVKADFPHEFAGVPEPGQSGSHIPFRNDEMLKICVRTYVDEASAHFSTQHLFLDRMLRARPGISEEAITNDIHEFFRTTSASVYPLHRAIVIAAEHIRDNLLQQSPETVRKTRRILIALFLAVQMIPFGIIGYCAYKDLKKISKNFKTKPLVN